MAINQFILDILACPQCRNGVCLTDEKDGLICSQCKLVFPVRDNIPVMLLDEASKLS